MEETTWAKAGLTKEQYDALPARTQMDLKRQYNPDPVQLRRPTMRPLTPAELESIKDLPFHERHEKGRALQQTPAPTDT